MKINDQGQNFFNIIKGSINMRHPSSFHAIQPKGLDCYVILSIKSNAHFILDGQLLKANPNHVIIISPGTVYDYYNPEGFYINDWFRFECKDEFYFDKYQIPLNEFIPIYDIKRINIAFQEIIWEHNFVESEIKFETIDFLIRVLMNRLSLNYQSVSEKQEYSPYLTTLQELRMSVQADYSLQYNASDVSEMLGISISYFQHLYRRLFGISFKRDMINLRIENAKTMIQKSTLPLKEIAEHCGYASEVHFYRQFKKETGYTPSDYRTMDY